MTVEISNKPVFVDANILVYANLPLSPFQPQATEALKKLDEQGVELWVSRQILREYLSAMTRPGTLTGKIPINMLTDDVRYFAIRFRLAEDNEFVSTRLLTLAEQIPMGGKQIHDANIAATMQAYNVDRLLTHNVADFKRFATFITILPLIP